LQIVALGIFFVHSGSIFYKALLFFYALELEEMVSNTRRRKQRGGSHATLQGADFLQRHVNQHGGAATPLYGAPVGYTGVLDAGLRDSARLSEFDVHYNNASGMSDASNPSPQKGGARKYKKASKTRKAKTSKKAKKAKKSKASKKAKKSNKASRKQRGGMRELASASVGESPMLLTRSEYMKSGGADFSNPLLTR
jgi:hypothetical protein